MKKIYPLLLSFLVAFTAHGQVIQAVSMSPSESSSTTEANTAVAFTADKARKATFDYLKQALAPFETDKLKIIPNKVDSSLSSQDAITKASYANFINGLSNASAIEKQLNATESFDKVAKMKQISKLNQAFSIKKSAECFSKDENGNYVSVATLEGPRLVGAELAPLRENPRYGLVENYSQGFARISKDMVYGFKDLCGNTVIQPQYDYAEPFNDGKALVKKYFWHFIDASGAESEVLDGVVQGKAVRFGISLATFSNQKVALIDNNFATSKKPVSLYFDEIEPFVGDLFRVRNNKLFGLIKIDGSAVIDIAYDRIYLSDKNQWIIIEQNKKVGLIDVDGNTRIKPTYESIISVDVNPKISKAATIIAKDASGFRIIELNERKISEVYSSIGLFNEWGLSQACKTNEKGVRCGFINYEGTEVIPSTYEKASTFSKDGLVVVSERNSNCSIPVGDCLTDLVYDHFGRIILGKTKPESPIAVTYAVTDTVIANTLVAVFTRTPTESGKFIDGYNLVNKISYARFTKEPYELIKKFDRNYFAIRKNNVWGLIDNFGNEVLTPTYMDLVHSSDGFFGVMYDNEKYGYIDETGKIMITFEYTEINPFSDGLAIVSQGKNKYGIINKFNAKIAPCMFKSVVYDADSKNYSLTDRSNVFVLNKEGDCVSNNCKDFYDILKKANRN